MIIMTIIDCHRYNFQQPIIIIPLLHFNIIIIRRRYSGMKALDGDGGLLARGAAKAVRDIVQFIP
jgi:hypothetical protein